MMEIISIMFLFLAIILLMVLVKKQDKEIDVLNNTIRDLKFKNEILHGKLDEARDAYNDLNTQFEDYMEKL